MEQREIQDWWCRHHRRRWWPWWCACGGRYPCGPRRLADEAATRLAARRAEAAYPRYFAAHPPAAAGPGR